MNSNAAGATTTSPRSNVSSLRGALTDLLPTYPAPAPDAVVSVGS